MYISILSSLVLGTILGRFYKFPILIPVYALAIISMLIRSGLKPFGLTTVLIELIVFILSVQIGYIVVCSNRVYRWDLGAANTTNTFVFV